MRKQKISLKFFLNTSKTSKKNEIPIYFRIIVERKKVELSTNLYVSNPKEWNEQAQRLNKKPVTNGRLSEIETDINNIIKDLEYRKRNITAHLIKNIYCGAGISKKELKKFAEYYIEKFVLPNTALSAGTKKNYRVNFHHLEDFLATSNQENILLMEIDTKFISDFEYYLKHKKQGLSISSIANHHKKLSTILKKAIQENELEKNPYSEKKIEIKPSERTFLTKGELDAITNHPLGNNESLKKVRDIFVFSVYTGLRYSDAIGLTTKEIQFFDNIFWVIKKQKKTNREVVIPMLDKAKEIFDKYAHIREVTGFVLPRLSNTKINLYLKTIADFAGINKPLTHQVARHTFATTIQLDNGTPLEQVSSMLGHTKLQQTRLYAKTTTSVLSRTAGLLNEKLK